MYYYHLAVHFSQTQFIANGISGSLSVSIFNKGAARIGSFATVGSLNLIVFLSYYKINT